MQSSCENNYVARAIAYLVTTVMAKGLLHPRMGRRW